MSGFFRFIAIIFLACFSLQAVADECIKLIALIESDDPDGYTGADYGLSELSVQTTYKKCTKFDPFKPSTWGSLVHQDCSLISKTFPLKDATSLQNSQNGTELSLICLEKVYFGKAKMIFSQDGSGSPTLSPAVVSLDFTDDHSFNKLKGKKRVCLTATFSGKSFSVSVDGSDGLCPRPS